MTRCQSYVTRAIDARQDAYVHIDSDDSPARHTPAQTKQANWHMKLYIEHLVRYAMRPSWLAFTLTVRISGPRLFHQPRLVASITPEIVAGMLM